MSTRQNDLRTSAGDFDAHDVGTNPIPLTVALSRHLLLFRQDGVGAPEVDDDIPLLETLNDAVDELAFTSFKFVIDNLPFRIAHALHDVLFGCLGGNATKQARIQLAQQLIPQLGVGIECFSGLVHSDFHRRILHRFNHSLGLEQFDLPDLGVELCFDLTLVTKGLFGRRDHGIFQSADENGFVDTFFFADLFDNSIEILLHVKRSSRARNSTFRSW